MHTSGGHGGPRPEPNAEMGFEEKDIDAKPLVKWTLIIMFGFTIFVYIIVALWYRLHNADVAEEAKKARAAVSVMPANAPLLQDNITAKTDIMTLRRFETAEMINYGASKYGAGRIPIERAKALLVEKGLPAVTSEAPAKSIGNTIPQNAIGKVPAGTEATIAR